MFRAIVTESIDAVAARGECDFVKDIAVPLPLKLIAEMIGIRREDFDRFHHWSDAMIAADGTERPGGDRARRARLHGVLELRHRRSSRTAACSPRDDLVSILTGAKDDGILGRFDVKKLHGADDEHLALANDELIMLCVILLVAGNETTRNGISGGMQLLIENPGERQKLIDDPALIPSAVEEMVRLVSPVHAFSRTATRDIELRGKQIREGQRVLLLYPSANRDADVFAQPDSFRVERNPTHLGFGIGTHFCLGANLARMEMRVAFEELLRRIPDMHYAAGGPVIAALGAGALLRRDEGALHAGAPPGRSRIAAGAARPPRRLEWPPRSDDDALGRSGLGPRALTRSPRRSRLRAREPRARDPTARARRVPAARPGPHGRRSRGERSVDACMAHPPSPGPAPRSSA